MAVYDITPETLRMFAVKIEGLANEYQTLYNTNLYNNLVDTQLKEAYQGSDADAVTARLESYRQPFTSMKNQLDKYAQFLRSVAETYDSTAADLAGQASQIGRL